MSMAFAPDGVFELRQVVRSIVERCQAESDACVCVCAWRGVRFVRVQMDGWRQDQGVQAPVARLCGHLDDDITFETRRGMV